MTACAEKVYQNAGNLPLLELLKMLPAGSRVLDCGCGSGDNARILQARGYCVTGITISQQEQEQAAPYCQQVYLADLERGIPAEAGHGYDAVLLSHVLEHLVHPRYVLRDASRVLAPAGLLAVALPNVLVYWNRWNFLRGRFEYTPRGIMDETHVHFYTFTTGQRLLTGNGFTIVTAQVDGAFPLWKLRGLLPASLSTAIEKIAGRCWPDLFGIQSLYLARACEMEPAHGV